MIGTTGGAGGGGGGGGCGGNGGQGGLSGGGSFGVYLHVSAGALIQNSEIVSSDGGSGGRGGSGGLGGEGGSGGPGGRGARAFECGGVAGPGDGGRGGQGGRGGDGGHGHDGDGGPSFAVVCDGGVVILEDIQLSHGPPELLAMDLVLMVRRAWWVLRRTATNPTKPSLEFFGTPLSFTLWLAHHEC